MTHTALIKFAPLHTLERHNDVNWNRADRCLYEHGSLRFAPGVTEVPLLVNHDDDREIGTVHELVRMEWTDGPWMCARATIHDKPEWLHKGTKASFSLSPYERRSFSEGELIAHAIVNEVSVLAGKRPAEPCAEVLLLKREEAPAPIVYRKPAPPPAARIAARRISPTDETDELQRRMEWLGDNASMETVLVNLQNELTQRRRGF